MEYTTTKYKWVEKFLYKIINEHLIEVLSLNIRFYQDIDHT